MKTPRKLRRRLYRAAWYLEKFSLGELPPMRPRRFLRAISHGKVGAVLAETYYDVCSAAIEDAMRRTPHGF